MADSQHHKKKAIKIAELIRNIDVVSEPPKRGAGNRIRRNKKKSLVPEKILDIKIMGMPYAGYANTSGEGGVSILGPFPLQSSDLLFDVSPLMSLAIVSAQFTVKFKSGT